MTRIGAAQLQDIQDDIPRATKIIQEYMEKSDRSGIDIICFPECFLQGYTLDETATKSRALNLSSTLFQDLLAKLSGYSALAILGLIERDGDKYFNTAAVISKGKVLGRYRKTHLFEANFQPGGDYPVFSVGRTTFGINVCYDARFADGAAALAKKARKSFSTPLITGLYPKRLQCTEINISTI